MAPMVTWLGRGRQQTGSGKHSIEPVRVGLRKPRLNGIAERFIGSVRRELLDHIVVLRHLERLSLDNGTPPPY